MIFWIGTALFIFILSVILAYFSMRSVAQEGQTLEAIEQLPPQPHFKTAPKSPEDITVPLNPESVVSTQPEQTFPSLPVDDVAVNEAPDQTNQTASVSSATETADIPPQTIEAARKQLQTVIAKTGPNELPDEAVSKSSNPATVGAFQDTTIKTGSLGNFLGTITIQQRPR